MENTVGQSHTWNAKYWQFASKFGFSLNCKLLPHQTDPRELQCLIHSYPSWAWFDKTNLLPSGHFACAGHWQKLGQVSTAFEIHHPGFHSLGRTSLSSGIPAGSQSTASKREISDTDIAEKGLNTTFYHKWFLGAKMRSMNNLTFIWLTSTISKTSNPTFTLSFSVEECFLGTNSFLYFSLSSLIRSHSCSSLPSSQLNSWLHFLSIEIHSPFQQVNWCFGLHYGIWILNYIQFWNSNSIHITWIFG